MLSQADLDVVSRESRIPGLALLLDLPALSDRLQTILVDQSYLNYKPGTSCTISVIDKDDNALAVLAYPDDRFRQIRSRSKWFNGPIRATLLEDVCVVVVPMQLDRRVKAARILGDPASRHRFYRRLFYEELKVEPVCDVLLRYKPKRRIVSRMHLSDGTSAILKCFNHREFDNAARGAQLCRLASGVELYGIDRKHQALAMAWVEGRSLCPVLSGGLHAEDFHETGRWLAKFHRQPPVCDLLFARETPVELVRPMQTIAADFSALAPVLAARIHRVVRMASEACTRVPVPRTLIHGDLSADQVIVALKISLEQDSTVRCPVVIDWDRARYGSSLRDVGSVLARLDHQVLTGDIDRNDAQCAAKAFVSGYRDRLPRTDPTLIAAFHARALLLLINEGFRNRTFDWHRLAEALLDRVEALLSTPRAPAAGTLIDDRPRMLRAALRVDEMTPILTRLVSEARPASLEPPTLLRYKPGRRALIRYEAVVNRGDRAEERIVVLGKLRLRKPDLKTPALHDALRRNGLDGQSAHAIGVPKQLGQYDELHLWFQQRVPGKVLSLFLRPGADTTPFFRAGKALAQLHATSVDTVDPWTLSDEAGVLHRALIKAATARPDLAQRIQYLHVLVQELFDTLRTAKPKLIHRDFYPDQLLIDGDRVWLVDLDLCALGDPCIDVGNFLAHLIEHSIRCFGVTDALDDQADAFRHGYRRYAARIHQPRIDALVALSLARHIYISTTFADRRHTTETLLSQCEARIAANHRTPLSHSK